MQYVTNAYRKYKTYRARYRRTVETLSVKARAHEHKVINAYRERRAYTARYRRAVKNAPLRVRAREHAAGASVVLAAVSVSFLMVLHAPTWMMAAAWIATWTVIVILVDAARRQSDAVIAAYGDVASPEKPLQEA